MTKTHGAMAMVTSWAAVSLAGCAVGMTTSSSDEGSRSVEVGATSGSGPARDQQSTGREHAPDVGQPESMTMPQTEDYTLDNGLRVVLVRRDALPLVSLAFQFRGGASAHTVEQAGLAGLVADMIDEGTARRNALQIAEAIDRIGARLSSTAGYDMCTVRLATLRSHLPEALDVVADIVMNPTFPEAELERVRAERVARVIQRSDQPAALADDAFARVLYGENHPYGAPLLGSRESLSSLTVDDVRAYHAARYAPGQATLVAVGDVEREGLDSLLADAFAGWSGRGEDLLTLPEARDGPGGLAIYIVDKPGAAQSEVRIGRVARAWRSEGYHETQVTNTVLGGSFTSRLNTTLREEKGYTYGAYSYFDQRRGRGPFEAGAAVATSVTDSAVLDFVREIDRLGADTVPEDELGRARNYLARRLPQRFESIDDVVARLGELVAYEAPLDFYATYVDSVLAVGADRVQATARRELETEDMVIVIAGDRSAIEAPLRALGLGPVRVLEEGSAS
jgi:zinc protease